MKVKDILEQKCTVLIDSVDYSSKSFRQQDLTVREILTSLSDKWKHKIAELRAMDYHSEEQMAAKKHYPCWITAGTFPYKHVGNDDILTYTNIIAVDADVNFDEKKLENIDVDFDTLKHQLLELPYVFYVSKSISGKGVYALVLVEDGKKSSAYIDYLANLWSNKFGVSVDTKSKGINRKRFLSYDENAIMKDEDTDIIPWKLVPPNIPIEQPKPQQRNLFGQTNDDEHIEWTRNAIWKVLDGGYTVQGRDAWYHVGCEFANFEDGFDMFKKLSDNYGEQRESITKKWNECLKAPTGITAELHRKWQGMAKNRYGIQWWKN